MVVAEHKEGDEAGPEEHKPKEHLTSGPWHLDPGCDLPATQVSKVVQEKGGEGDKELGGPQRARILAEGLNVGGDGGEDEAGDEEKVDDAKAQAGCLLQDGAEGWYWGVTRSHQRGIGRVLGWLLFTRKHVGWANRPHVVPVDGEGMWSEHPRKQDHLDFLGQGWGDICRPSI